jgi:hypothetical protein
MLAPAITLLRTRVLRQHRTGVIRTSSPRAAVDPDAARSSGSKPRVSESVGDLMFAEHARLAPAGAGGDSIASILGAGGGGNGAAAEASSGSGGTAPKVAAVAAVAARAATGADRFARHLPDPRASAPGIRSAHTREKMQAYVQDGRIPIAWRIDLPNRCVERSLGRNLVSRRRLQ